MTADLVLLSPLDGWAAPLSEVPDPVFAEAMLGDGVAVDPTSAVLKAPCDGVVTSVHGSRHAVSLRAAGGAEILMHVGLETVALKGAGFEAHVHEGQAVKAGDRLGRMGNTPEGTIPVARSHVHLEIGVICSPRFDRWFHAKKLKPNHGLYNGMNLLGFNPLAQRVWRGA